MTRASILMAVLAGVALLALPEVVLAHGGLVGRQDLPIPRWLFGWGAAIVLIVSFLALATLWPNPKLESDSWRPLPAWFGRPLTSAPAQMLAGAAGLFLLVLTLVSGLRGDESTTENFAPTFVFVVFWVGLAFASALLGDVFRPFNPWRASARAISWAATKAAGGPVPAPFSYPGRLGHWPAAIGLFAFAALELVVSGGSEPRTVALATLVYSVITWLGMFLFGIEDWSRRGEAFGVYFNLFSRLAPVERRGRELGLRRPLAGLAAFEPQPGTVALVAAMIGSTTFDGLAEGPFFQSITPTLNDLWRGLGLGVTAVAELTFLTGLIGCILFVYGFYLLAVLGARSAGGGFSVGRLADAFVHSLVPIALVYVAAHYVSLLLFQGQAVPELLADPLGAPGAPAAIDYSILSAQTFWYMQVGLVIAGHVAALMLAHDRALVLYMKSRQAVQSQYWMLGVMVGFTSLALWLLAQANEG